MIIELIKYGCMYGTVYDLPSFIESYISFDIYFVQVSEIYGAVQNILEYIESCILFKNTTKNIQTVFKNTYLKYVVTLYTNANTYINFLPHTNEILNIFNMMTRDIKTFTFKE